MGLCVVVGESGSTPPLDHSRARPAPTWFIGTSYMVYRNLCPCVGAGLAREGRVLTPEPHLMGSNANHRTCKEGGPTPPLNHSRARPAPTGLIGTSHMVYRNLCPCVGAGLAREGFVLTPEPHLMGSNANHRTSKEGGPTPPLNHSRARPAPTWFIGTSHMVYRNLCPCVGAGLAREGRVLTPEPYE